MKKWVKYIIVGFGFLFFIVALLLLHNQLKNLSYADIANALKAIPSFRIAVALFLTLSYYIILGGYDIIAFKYIGSKVQLKLKDILFTCFISNVLGSNTGYSMLFGGSIRYRLYSLYNVSMVDITKVLLFSSVTIWLGLLTVGGFIFTVAPVSLKGIAEFNFSIRTIGVSFIVVLVLYILLSVLHSKPVKLFKWTITFPNIKIVSSQILVAVCDWLVASFVLYILMPAGEISYFILLKVFLVSQLLGIISQTPGGIVVFEASFTSLIPSSLNSLGVIGGLLAYRAIFYFYPLLIALALLGSFELVTFTKKFTKTTKLFGKTVSSFIVRIIALSSFFAGVFAIFSAVTPFNFAQLKFVLNFIPAWFADLSHFLLSMTAASLLFIARGLQLRIKNAQAIACILISFAIFLMFIVGETYLLLLCFSVLLIALLVSKKYFYRNISVLNTTFSAWWLSTITGVLILSLWLGFFINRRDIFSWTLDMWYRNILNATDTARFLRAGIGMGIIIFIVIFNQILRNFFKKSVPFTMDDVRNIVNLSDYTYSFNALASDKSYILDDKKNAFIMYAKSKDSWIALGDPVGRHGDKNELLWKFKEIADNASAKLAFIGVDHKYVQIYSDIGLDTFNIGREAKVLLKTFDKNKGCFKYFCRIEEEIERAGFNYKTLSADQFERYKDVFTQINKDWEKSTNYLDRNFIPGRYDESYMKDMDFGILEKDSGIYAFSVIAKTKNKHEASSGIVRYIKCDKDIFTYMVFKNILWAKENGYKWFDLGFAYFPALDNGNEVIKHFAKMFMFAEHFNYNIASLMEFKDKFCPIWRNKYIAVHTAEYIVTFIKNFVTLVFPSEIINNRHLLIRSFKK